MWHTYIACNSAVYQRQYLQQHRVKCMPNAKGAQGKSRSGCQRDKTTQDRGTGANDRETDRQTEVTKFNTQAATQTTLRSVKVAAAASAAAAAVSDVDYF